MIWVYAAVGLAAAGLAVLGWLSVKVCVATRDLGREVERARRLLAPASSRVRQEIEVLGRARG
ncbi:MAG TPA: hypothetical protein VIR33_02585 [Thermopolyspora sp.]|jgi:hypothetical protein